MSTSSTAKLPDGNELYFTDSGPVPNSNDYTTLLIFHGSSFHGCFCTRSLLHSFAAAHNFRTINVNRKDYPGSTKYADAELEDLKNGRLIFLERLGTLVAYLIDYFIQEGNVPKVNGDRSAGGIVPVGWSMGTATMMALFSNPALIPKEVSRDLLEQYVRDIILYDPPHLSFGYEVPKGHNTYVPWTDPDCKTGEERYKAFNGWVSSYFDEPDGWAGDISALDMRKRTERATMNSWTSEEMAAICDAQAAVRSELPMCANSVYLLAH
ncbi:hypothetical protein BDQ12DRAFT_603738 [Crucibulum laeve]|uniref:AB hydrolase-1 domain-containing protein n=1 Tax=Crucibulum laeve TaxID=68775 RepID=A0A5C3M2L2_9AGAR|nr:hypothetical protein BDQ12DRAFT_603738 [Crucibulum laeve]